MRSPEPPSVTAAHFLPWRIWPPGHAGFGFATLMQAGHFPVVPLEHFFG
jgi:hypothetical protein